MSVRHTPAPPILTMTSSGPSIVGFWYVGELQLGVVSDHLHGFHHGLLVLVLVNCIASCTPPPVIVVAGRQQSAAEVRVAFHRDPHGLGEPQPHRHLLGHQRVTDLVDHHPAVRAHAQTEGETAAQQRRLLAPLGQVAQGQQVNFVRHPRDFAESSPTRTLHGRGVRFAPEHVLRSSSRLSSRFGAERSEVTGVGRQAGVDLLAVVMVVEQHPDLAEVLTSPAARPGRRRPSDRRSSVSRTPLAAGGER